jgi:glucan-binding YG repeat protein
MNEEMIQFVCSKLGTIADSLRVLKDAKEASDKHMIDVENSLAEVIAIVKENQDNQTVRDGIADKNLEAQEAKNELSQQFQKEQVERNLVTNEYQIEQDRRIEITEHYQKGQHDSLCRASEEFVKLKTSLEWMN